MIAGIGCDLLDMRRLRAMLARRPRLAARVLSAAEMQEYESHRAAALYLGGRIAAKEAFSKALGCGMRLPVTWRRVSVLTTASGAPSFEFSAPLQQHLQQQGITSCHLSITHDGDYVSAFVITEKADA